MKIVITGATGNLGRYVVDIISRKYECRLIGRSGEKLNYLFGTASSHETIPSDYSIDSLLYALSGVQAVIHLAGLRPGDEPKGLVLYQENLRITMNLFEACKSLGISNIVFASSSSVYTPGIDSLPFRENVDLFPVSHYAAGKLACEKLGAVYGFRMKSLRIAPIIGLYERSNYVRIAHIHKALRNEPLAIHGDGSGAREYLYAKDAAQAVRLALEKPELAAVINIGTGMGISQRRYAASVNKVFAEEGSDILYYPERPGYRDIRYMSCKKAHKLLGYRPAYSLNAALLDLRRDMENEEHENPFQ